MLGFGWLVLKGTGKYEKGHKTKYKKSIERERDTHTHTTHTTHTKKATNPKEHDS